VAYGVGSGKSKVKKPLAKMPNRQAMIDRINDACDEDNRLDDEVTKFCDGYEVSGPSELMLVQLRRLYAEIINPPVKITNDKESVTVESFEATVITNKMNRTVTVHIEDAAGNFLDANMERVERPLGGDMPVFMAIPQEIYEAIRRA